MTLLNEVSDAAHSNTAAYATDAALAIGAITAPLWIVEIEWYAALCGAVLVIPLIILRIAIAWRDFKRKGSDP